MGLGGAMSGAASGAAAGSIAGPVGSIVGGLIGAAGSYFSGKSAEDYAMYSTKHKYRWMVNDLQKAGLNPMLAVSQSPGSPAQPEYPNIGEGALKGASAVAQTRLAQAQLANTQETTNATRAAANKTMAEGESQEMANLITRTSPEYQQAKAKLGEFGEVTGSSAGAQAKFDAGLKQVAALADKASTEAETAKIQRDIAQNELSLSQVKVKYADQLGEIETQYREALKVAAQNSIPATVADAEFWSITGPWGRLGAVLKHLLGK